LAALGLSRRAGKCLRLSALKLDNSASFSGTVAGFARDINFATVQTPQYALKFAIAASRVDSCQPYGGLAGGATSKDKPQDHRSLSAR
jgi:hypothetical protein